jgi:hypothetical protein
MRSPKLTLCCGLALSASFLTLASARADELTLKDGEKIEGVVVDSGDEVVVHLDFGDIGIAKSEVASIRRGDTPLSELAARRAKIGARDVKGLLDLALWVEQNGLSTNARAIYREVIAIEPGQEHARAVLGYRKKDGQWLTEDEFNTASGLVRHEGRWMRPEEKAALEAEETEARNTRLAAAEERAAKAEAALRAERQAAADAGAAAAEEGEGALWGYGPTGWGMLGWYSCGGRYLGRSFPAARFAVAPRGLAGHGAVGVVGHPGFGGHGLSHGGVVGGGSSGGGHGVGHGGGGGGRH